MSSGKVAALAFGGGVVLAVAAVFLAAQLGFMPAFPVAIDAVVDDIAEDGSARLTYLDAAAGDLPPILVLSGASWREGDTGPWRTSVPTCAAPGVVVRLAVVRVLPNVYRDEGRHVVAWMECFP